jgi:uncharacterized integral membrane protein
LAVLSKLKMGLPYKPAIELLDLYHREMKAYFQAITYIIIFILALIIIAQN